MSTVVIVAVFWVLSLGLALVVGGMVGAETASAGGGPLCKWLDDVRQDRKRIRDAETDVMLEQMRSGNSGSVKRSETA